MLTSFAILSAVVVIVDKYFNFNEIESLLPLDGRINALKSFFVALDKDIGSEDLQDIVLEHIRGKLYGGGCFICTKELC